MSDIAFLFPGQGSQFAGMVQELAAYPEALEIFRRASRDLGFDLFELCLGGPEEKLSQDLYAQLAVHATNCAYAALLRKMNFIPRLASGFSLGIFSALVAAGSLSFKQGLEGVRIAAEKMSVEGKRHRGAMAAVIGLSENEVQAICQELPQAFVASINNARQVVISGKDEAVEKAMILCQQRGALITKRLPISWAIHTPLMKRTSQSFAEVIRDWKVSPPHFPVLSYLRAENLRTPEEIKEELSSQFSHQNCWHRVLLRMIAEGIDTFVEVGPGNVLTQMVRWVSRQAQTFTAEEIFRNGNRMNLEKSRFPLPWREGTKGRGRKAN
ncbi:MAG: ACP S-malonyltransferase [Deltaproteobacteria bacterium]|nr:ACP S-malonyltransferase [Deltaproteobacteria bacterium]